MKSLLQSLLSWISPYDRPKAGRLNVMINMVNGS